MRKRMNNIRNIAVIFLAPVFLAGCPDLDLGSGSSGASSACPVGQGPFEVGEEGPTGGWVFFVDENDEFEFDYLEAAREDRTVSRSDGDNALHEWAVSFVGRDLDVPESSTEFGTGAKNTQLIIDALNNPPEGAESQQNKAAQVATSQVPTGCDWFLPSRDELDRMYRNLAQTGLGDFSGSRDYWSSSQADTLNAWTVSFQDGSATRTIKAGANRVRAVRAGNF